MNSKKDIIKVKEKLINFLISPWLLAMPVAVIIILFLPPIKKYKIDLIKTGVRDKPDSFVTYSDLDGDGYSEKIILFNNQRGDAAIKVVNQSEVQMGWWDFKGIIYNDTPKFGDYDHDGKPEIYFISNYLDSLFLNILSPAQNQSFITKQQFVTLANVKDRLNDYSVSNWYFCDLQLDDSDEVLFHIFAGYSLQPRRLYAYDQKHDSLLAGPLMGCQTYFIPTQLDEDQYIEFLGQTSSTGNMLQGMNIPYNDRSSWFMALDHKLKFIFEPIEFKGHKTFLESQTMSVDNSTNILVLFELFSDTPLNPCLLLYDSLGNLIKKKELEKPTSKEYYTLLFHDSPNQDRLLLKDASGLIYKVDDNFNLQKTGQLPGNFSGQFTSFDIDNDGSDEFIFMSTDFERLYITRIDFSHTAEIKIPFEKVYYYLSKQENGKNAPFLYVKRGDREMWFSYGFNKLWYAKFPIWIGIYFTIFGFIQVIRRFQVIQQKKLKAREDQLAGLQMEAVSTYLDPHFTFNTLNTISSLIYKEEKGKAHEVLTRFTSLIRATLMQSGKVARTLSDELEFVRNYLDIQQFRFGNLFTWEIKNEDNILLSIPVPKMLVQQYTENAIKHGLKNKGKGGRLDIILQHQDNETRIIIRDNGVGREKAKEFGEAGTGRGLLTMQNIFDLFEKTNKIKISQTINDLTDDSGNPSGTEVILTIRKL